MAVLLVLNCLIEHGHIGSQSLSGSGLEIKKKYCLVINLGW